MKLFSVFLLAALLSLTLGCKGGKGQQASTPTPTPVPVIDTDKDGIADATDPDDDNDGVADSLDRFPQDPTEMRDSDGDNQGDKADLDDDNDGLADTLDAYPLDPKEQKDSDNDGLGDNADADDDNDTIPDTTDRFPLSNLEAADTDGDGLGNNADPDDDNDGVADAQDALPLNPQETSDIDKDGIGDKEDLDKDNDGVADSADKFPLDSKDAKDADADGIGDNADTDDDNDGTPDVADAQPFNPKEQTDTDGDGIGNHQDDDDDNDGVVDNKDKLPLDAKEVADFDSDGIGDNADVDDDNDSINDAEDKILGLTKNTTLALSNGASVRLANSGAIAYVVNSDNRSLAAIDLATGAVVKSITLTESPKLISLSPDGTRIFIATNSGGSNEFWPSQFNRVQVFSAADFGKVADMALNDSAGSITALSSQQFLLTPGSSSASYLYDVTLGFLGYAVNSGLFQVFDAPSGVLFSGTGTWLTKSVRSGNSFQTSISSSTVLSGNDDQLWLNPDGRYLISSTGRVISTENLVKSHDLVLEAAKITSVYFDNANNLAFLSLSSGSLAIVRADTFEFIQYQPVASLPLMGVAVVAGKLVSIAKDVNSFLALVSQPYNCPDCVLNAAPKAVVVVDNASPFTAQMVQFDASGATDSDQDTLRYRWDFNNDDNWDTDFSSTPKASYQYILPGKFNAMVQVVDAKGATSTAVVNIRVKQAKELPLSRGQPTGVFDFPVVNRVFDGKDTLYYLDAANNRVHLVSLATGRSERYFQFDYPVKEIFKSADANNIFVVQQLTSPQQTINTLVSTISAVDQAVVDSLLVKGQLSNFAYVDSARFMATSNEISVIDSATDAIIKLTPDFFYSYFNSESGALYKMGSSDLARVNVIGSSFVIEKHILKEEYFGVIGAPYYLSMDEKLLVGSNAAIATDNKSDRLYFTTPVVKTVGDPLRNVVFAITSAGTVEVLNSTSGQRIQTITLSKPIRDVVVKDDRLYAMLEINFQQWTLLEIAHPCLACKANQYLDVSIVAPQLKAVGKVVNLSIESGMDEVINNWLFRWDLNGDGAWDGPFTVASAVQTTFALPGIKVISGQAKNALGDVGKATQTFEVAPGASLAENASNTSAIGRFNAQTIVAAAGGNNLFLVADPQSRKLYFYDVLLEQVTKELTLEMFPEAIKLSPDKTTAFIQLVDRAPLDFSGSGVARRYVMRIDIAQYTATHSFILPSTVGGLALVLSADRILVSDTSNSGVSLLDGHTGAVLSSLRETTIYGARAVLNNRIYVSVGAYIDFSNDVLTYKVFSAAPRDAYATTWLLPGNQYVLDSEGRKLDTTTLKIVSTQPLPQGVSADRIEFFQEGKLAVFTTFGEMVFFNFETMQRIKSISAYDAYASFIADGQLFVFGNSPSARKLVDVCTECTDNQKPLAKLSLSVGSFDTATAIKLDASASTDPENSSLTYRWDFDDDGTWDSDFSSVAIQSKKFLAPGKITVRVQVKDAGGNLADASATFDVAQAVDAGVAIDSTRPYMFTDVPQAPIVDEVNGYLYYLAQDRNRVYAMNLSTGLVERYFQFETRPQYLSLSPDNKLAYIVTPGSSTNFSNQYSDAIVSAIDLASRSIIHAFRVNYGVNSLVALGDKRVVVGKGDGTKMSVFDAASGQALADFPQGTVLRGQSALDASTVLVSQISSNRLAKYRFDPVSMMVSGEEIPDSSSSGYDAFWLSPDKTRIVYGSGVIYSLNDFSVLARLPVTAQFSSAVFTSDTRFVWVDYFGNSRLHEFNLTTSTDSVGAVCNCQALFSYAGQAWAIKRDEFGNVYAAKAM